MRILFLTTNDFGFGGSELLWIKTAIHMTNQGHTVGASVKKWSPKPALLSELESSQVQIHWHQYPPREDDFQNIAKFNPELVCVSTGYHLEGLDWLQRLASQEIPFVIVFHAVHELGFTQLNESNTQRYIAAHSQASWRYFVSVNNKRLYERMLGIKLEPNISSIVRNPYSVPFLSLCATSWPNQDTLNLATVGRIECYHKGYDLLAEAFGNGGWSNRPFRLNVYGEGPHKDLIARLWKINNLPLEKLVFHGHVTDIEEIWKNNHVLIQPSRLEGLPISVVEASLCGRPTLATDVAGHTEIIEDQDSGFIATAPTVKSIQKALESMWKHRIELPSIGMKARKSAEALIPRYPEYEFHKSLLSLVESGNARTDSSYPPANSPKPCDGHVFKTLDSESKQDLLFDKNCDVTITLSNCKGTIRFDPTIEPAIIHIKAITISVDDAPEFLVQSSSLKSILSIKGTAKRLKHKRNGFWIESIGKDPNLLIHGGKLAKNSFYNLRILLHVY